MVFFRAVLVEVVATDPLLRLPGVTLTSYTGALGAWLLSEVPVSNKQGAGWPVLPLRRLLRRVPTTTQHTLAEYAAWQELHRALFSEVGSNMNYLISAPDPRRLAATGTRLVGDCGNRVRQTLPPTLSGRHP